MNGEDVQRLVEAIKVALQNPLPHWRGCSASLGSLRADGRRATGLIGVRKTAVGDRTNSRVGRRAGRVALEIVRL